MASWIIFYTVRSNLLLITLFGKEAKKNFLLCLRQALMRNNWENLSENATPYFRLVFSSLFSLSPSHTWRKLIDCEFFFPESIWTDAFSPDNLWHQHFYVRLVKYFFLSKYKYFLSVDFSPFFVGFDKCVCHSSSTRSIDVGKLFFDKCQDKEKFHWKKSDFASSLQVQVAFHFLIMLRERQQ